MAQEKRKPFQGKRVHKDLRDYKNQEIKRSLVHRARLRKNYFKLLDKEGVPEGHENPYADFENKTRDEDAKSVDEFGSAEEGSDSEEESMDAAGSKDNLKAAEGAKKRAPLTPQAQMPKPKETVPKRKPLNFAERAKLARDRKDQRRDDELRRVQERRQHIEANQKERERKKLSLSKRTRRGQPVMGPKINDLLDKIKSNN